MGFKGKLIPPKLTTAERDAITSPSDGEVIFNITDDTIQYYDLDDTIWRTMFSEGGTPIPPSEIGGGAGSEVMSFASGGNKHVNSTSPTYESLAHIIYSGSVAVGAIQTININAWVDGAGTADVRIIDLNTGLNIVELTGINSMLESNVQDMGTITNLPTTPTAFEIQGKKTTGGGGVKLLIASIQSIY